MPDPTPQQQVAGLPRPVAPVPDDGGAGLINIPHESVVPVMREAPHPSANQVHNLMVNGRQVQMTTEQLYANVQKDLAGDEKLRTAAEQEKAAQTALAAEADLTALFKDGDPDAFRRLGAKYGVSGNEVEDIIDQYWADPEEEGTEGSREGDPVEARNEEVAAEKQPSRPRQVGYDELSPDLQRALKIVEKSRIDEITKQALDKDEVVRYNMTNYTDVQRSVVQKLVAEKIKGRLDQSDGDFGDGSQILKEIVPEIREIIEAIGGPQRTHGALNLGPSPGGGDNDVYPSKLPDHVSSSDGGFEQNVLETMAFHQANAERGAR